MQTLFAAQVHRDNKTALMFWYVTRQPRLLHLLATVHDDHWRWRFCYCRLQKILWPPLYSAVILNTIQAPLVNTLMVCIGYHIGQKLMDVFAFIVLFLMGLPIYANLLFFATGAALVTMGPPAVNTHFGRDCCGAAERCLQMVHTIHYTLVPPPVPLGPVNIKQMVAWLGLAPSK